MKNILIVFSFLGFNTVFSQNWCLSNEVLENWLNKDPEARSNYLNHLRDAKTQDSIAFSNSYRNDRISTATVYTIPVVFHVLYYGNLGLIDDAQIIDEMSILNRDYRKLNPDTINIYPPFVAADVGFEFRLATKDTNGNCTNGITRHYDPHTSWNTIASIDNFKYTWDPTKYLNIYVINDLPSGDAYSNFPGQGAGFNDVIVIKGKCVGSIGTSNAHKSRTLTHEIGHWFDLRHVWGSGASGVTCGDDGVSDTPITKGFTVCPSNTVAICNPTISENFQNYMDYSFCSAMFTQGQVNRMIATITSTVGGRNNLWSNSNLIATGIINPNGVCPPIPDFFVTLANKSGVDTICTGQSLTFTDASYNAVITAWQWSAGPGATIASPTSSVTAISFANVGTTTVNLSVSSSAGATSITKAITALSATPNIASFYQESFETSGLPTNFQIINTDADVTWQQTSLAAATGSNSYYIQGSVDAPGSNADILETPSYDFLNNQGASFTFRYAYARKNASNSDVFKIQVSSSCGGQWTDMSIGSNAVLSSGSGGTTTTPFIPTPTQFKSYDITTHPVFTPYLNESNVRFRFSFLEDPATGNGNNFYLDDINFNAPTGINELSRSVSFNVYPNPSNGTGYLKFILSETSLVEYVISDITGRIVEKGKKVQLDQGKHTIEFNSDQKFKAGMYIIDLKINNQQLNRKFSITE
jgi:hypothetical protein